MGKQPYKWMNLKDKSVVINVKVIPNSSKNSIHSEEDYLKIKITAPPVDNKANKALIEFLSKQFKIPKSEITLKSGGTSKLKKFEIPMNFIDNIKI